MHRRPLISRYWLASEARDLGPVARASGVCRCGRAARRDRQFRLKRGAEGRRPAAVLAVAVEVGAVDDDVLLLEAVGDTATEDPLRERRLARPDRQVDLVRGRELLGELEAGVAAADDQDRSPSDVLRRSVRAAVDLCHLRIEALGERGHERDLKRSGRDDDLLGLVRPPVVERERVATVGARDRTHGAVQLERQVVVLAYSVRYAATSSRVG